MALSVRETFTRRFANILAKPAPRLLVECVGDSLELFLLVADNGFYAGRSSISRDSWRGVPTGFSDYSLGHLQGFVVIWLTAA